MGRIYGWSEPAKEKGVDFCARSLKNHDFAKSFGSIFLPFSSLYTSIGPSNGKVWDFFALRALKITIFLGF